MTRSAPRVALGNSTSGKTPGRARHSRNLTRDVVQRLSHEIRSGAYGPGARLPTEHALMTAMGVSRTVVREAVAALRADGLVTSRQGAGVFVADASRAPFRIDPAGLGSIEDVLEVMELRLAIEVEAAGLAAQRASPKAVDKIRRALRSIDRALSNGEGAVKEDFDFHRAIAQASGNSRITELLTMLGHHIIPRQNVRVAIAPMASQRLYLTRIQQEHARIFAAIREGSAADARRAMHAHLTLSLERYRHIADGKLASKHPGRQARSLTAIIGGG